MPAVRRGSLLALAILFLSGSAFAWPQVFRNIRKPKTEAKSPAIPNGVHHPPVPSLVEMPYAGPPPVAVAHAVRTPPLRKMKLIPPPFRGEDADRVEPVHPQRPTDTPAEEDGRRQTFMGPVRSAPMPAGVSFEGVGTGLPGFSPCCVPPYVNGHVGATQYVQWNNLSFAIWDKSGNKLFGPAAGNTLFQPLGGVCASHNDGDPVVNYDVLAGRWILSQLAVFASPGFSHQCVAVSLTSDATGSWYLYDFVTDPNSFVDYPKMAVWPDGYYMTAHIFDSSGFSLLAGRIYAFERDKMLNGQPARMVSKDLKQYSGAPQYGFLAADLDSPIAPPAGEAEFVIGPDPATTTRLDSTRVAVTWGATPAMSLTEAQITADWGIPPCVGGSRACVPEPPPAGTSDYLDNLDQLMMHRLAYRNFAGSPVQESLVGNITVPGSTSTPAHGAIRWFEFRNAGDSTTTPTVYQAATFDPDNDYRWLGSMAMDKDHDIALGYSKSSTTVMPSIFLNGRLGTDPLNTLGTETQMMAGGGVQTSVNRWGDYSSMTIDPVDECTFWYTNEYLKANGSYNWATRIASFKFPSCTPTSWGTLSGTITSCASGTPIAGVIVSLGNGYSAASDAQGHYLVAVPAGTYTATAAGADINCSSSSPATVSVIVPTDGTTTQDFCMVGSSNLAFASVSVNDSAAGNGNGVINRNECVDLSVSVANNGCANESAINATLTTSTAGVTVTQGSSFYPDLVTGASSANSIPFKVSTSSTFVCGTTINFTLNLTYAGGSKSIAFTAPTCANGASQVIPASSIDSTDPTQSDRLFRDGVPSNCNGKACAGPFGSGTRNYKTFKFTNAGGSSACVTVTMNGACTGSNAGSVETVAYLGSTYTPPTSGTICNNYLGDAGVSVGGAGTPSSATFSFTVPAQSDFIIVANTVDPGTNCTQFSGTVSGLIDNTPGPGPCATCTPPATPSITAAGPTTFCTGGSVTLNSSAASGNQWYLNGAAIAGATGTSQSATASGSYTVTTTANGCVSAPAAAVTVTVNPIPATPTPSNAGPYCAGSTLFLSTPAVTGAAYAWTGPNSFTSTMQNPTRANLTAADAGTYSLTITVNGCTSSAGTTTVVVNPIPATPAPANSGPFCAGQTISLSAPTVTGATYAWTGPNGFTSTLQNPTRAGATAAYAGTYFVTVTVNGCPSAGGTTSVVVNPIPATPAASNAGPFCAGSTIALSTPAVSGATYAWTGPNGFTSSLQNPTHANATVADAGAYLVTVTVNGCTSVAGTTNVVVNTAVPATPTASNSGPFCEGTAISLSTPTVANATYAWTGPNGFTSSLQNPTRANAAAGDAGTYSVIVTADGCSSAAGTTNVVVTPKPATPAASNSGPFCEGGTISLSTPTVSGAAYAWTGPNGFASAQQNPTRASATAADFATYSVTITVNGCTSAAGTTTVVDSNAAATAGNGGPYCVNDTISLFTPLVTGATYAWTGPNGFTSTDQNPTRPNAAAADGGTYSVIVTTTGCTSLAGSTTVIVNTALATPSATNGGPYCQGSTISLSTPAVANATYSWIGPNGFTSTQQNPTIVNATLANAGTYSVTLFNGCTSSAGNTTVVINSTPATPVASNTGPFCAGGTISLSTSAVTGATYAWTGPNGFTSTQQSPTRLNATAADAGTYSVTVTVNGCTSAAGTTTVVVNTVPTPSPANGGPYCAGATIALATPIVTGATYAWTGPNGFTSSLPNPTRVNATIADAGTYSVTIAVNSCTSAAGTTNVVVNPIPAMPAASNSGPYCAGGTISLSTSAVSGATYAWTGPNGFTSSQQNPTRANATTADSGTYSVTVSVSGCTSPAGITSVVVNAMPSMPAASNGGPYCTGATILLSTPSVSGATYAWTGPNGFTSSQQNASRANAAIGDSGTYSVTITVKGCTSPAGTTNVVVNTMPATPAASNSGPYCAGGTISLSTAAVTGATYSWTGPSGFTSTLQNPTRANATVAFGGTYSVTVTVNGCTSAAGTTNVVVNSAPTPFPSNSGSYSEGQTISLFTGFVSGGTYAWTGPNGFTSSLQNPTRPNATPAFSGTYSVTVTVNGCTSSPGTTSVFVNPAPATPTISANGPTTFCAGGSVTLTSSSPNGAQWYRNGSLVQFGNPLLATTSGSYTVLVTTNGCPSAPSAATNVTVNAKPNATIGIGAVLGAGAPATAVVADAGAGATYLWTITNGTISSGNGTRLLNFVSGSFGQTTVNVTVTSASGCSDAKSASISIVPAIVTVTPSAGRTAGGTNVTIAGSGFQTGASVFFGTTLANNVVRVSANTITATSPAHTAGAVNVIVNNPDFSATFTNAFTYVTQQFDANGDGAIDPSDIFYLVNYLFLSGPPPKGPAGMMSGDANGDATVDPSDIFYAVNYLFLKGPAPKSEPGPVSAQSVGRPLSGSITLGDPVRKGTHYTIPVIVAASAASEPPQALSLRVKFSGDPVRNTVVHRADGMQQLFEISRSTADTLSYLITFDGDARDGVVAEIELDANSDANVNVDVDPTVTLLSDRAGMRTAKVSAGTLQVTGTKIEAPEPRARKKGFD